MTDPAGVRDLPPVHSFRIEEVRESPENPRVIPQRAVELVAGSLRRFGWKQPLVVDRDGMIVVGHTRYRAARLLKLTHVPGIVADDLTPEEVDAYRIADNRTGDFTTWDLPALTQQLDALADDFADVLALTDWEAVMAQYADLAGGGDTSLGLPEEVRNTLHGGGGFIVNVHFHTKEQGLAAEQTLIDLPGVYDVRHETA
jgi:hypothetical protein